MIDRLFVSILRRLLFRINLSRDQMIVLCNGNRELSQNPGHNFLIGSFKAVIHTPLCYISVSYDNYTSNAKLRIDMRVTLSCYVYNTTNIFRRFNRALYKSQLRARVFVIAESSVVCSNEGASRHLFFSRSFYFFLKQTADDVRRLRKINSIDFDG